MFDSKRDTLHFMVEVRATGWIGFGVATQAPTGMQGYDVAVGGVFNGSGYLQVHVFFKVFILAISFPSELYKLWGFSKFCIKGFGARYFS